MIHLETNHGSYELHGEPDDSIASVLTKVGIPLSSVWTYVVDELLDDIGIEKPQDGTSRSSARNVRFVSLNTKLSDPLIAGREIFARVTRNINIPGLLGFESRSVRTIERPSTEWTFPDEHAGAFGRVLCELSAEECFEFVCRSVDEVLGQWPDSSPPRLVVGVSGGGDSNVLLSALLRSGKIQPDNVLPVMMLGIPDWDTQLNNARELCSNLSLDLKVIEGEEAAELAGVSSFTDLKGHFVFEYPDADLEFLGTFLLRRVLGSYARRHGISYVAIGANREDMVAEGFARIARGKVPLPIPFRTIGDITIVYPMWKVPKKIGDGAYVTYSLENYEHRNPSYSAGRSIFYYLSYMLPDLIPGIDLNLLEAFSKLARLEQEPFHFDESLGDYVVKDSFTPEQREKWRTFLQLVSSPKSGA